MYSLDFESGGVVVMGSESHGIRPQVEEKIKTRLHIPAINSKAESLNASIATAICLSEIKRSVLKNI
jgi:TrmH family RNA methyltransferase